MKLKYHIIYKKNEDGKFEFYNIFISNNYDDVNLELGDEDISFASGKVCGICDDDFSKIINSSDKVAVDSIVKYDDDVDKYFSIVITEEQLYKFSNDLDLNFGLCSDAPIVFLDYLYNKFDSSELLDIKNVNDKLLVSHISFQKNKSKSENRNLDFYKKIYSLGIDSDCELDNISFDNFDVMDVIKDIESKVIGQDKTVETIVNNIYNNQKIIDTMDDDFIRTSKINILLDGPTATGKSLILRQCEKHFALPFYRVPVTTFSTVGYKGDDLVTILQNLLKKANGNLELAERGIVVLDEFDKLAATGDRGLEIRNGLQHELLSYIEGDKIPIDVGFGNKLEFDTSKITFIALGAFNDLREKKIKENNKSSIGFSSGDNDKKEDKTYKITVQDYVDEGIHRELIGRFGLLTSTEYLDYDKLIRILKESKISPSHSLVELGKLYGVDIVFSDEILSKIAEYALADGTGARGLKTIIGNLQNVILPDIISSRVDRVVITNDLLNKSRDFMVRGY